MNQAWQGRVRIRACGILVENNKWLLLEHQLPHGTFWLPPGGEVQFGERAMDAVVREMKEETNLHVEVTRFLCFQEFVQPPIHAVELYFEVKKMHGKIQLGTDPELTTQVLKNIAWISEDMFSQSSDPSFSSIQKVWEARKKMIQ